MAASSNDHDSVKEKYLDDDFAKWIQSRLLEEHQPGVSVAVIKDGQIESEGYGFAQLPDVPATADTLWVMASTTKAFTTTLLGKVMENQNSSSSSDNQKASGSHPVTWKTRISDILPEFITTDEYVTKYATLEDIASHRSGVAGHDLVWGPVMGPSLSTAARYMKHFEAIEGKFRSTWQYNNLMYGVLGNVIEQLSGEEFSATLEKEILGPLGMGDTQLGMPKIAQQVKSGAIPKSRMARGYHFVENKDKDDKGSSFYVPDQYGELTGVQPAGDLISSVNDYAKWVAALLNVVTTNDKDDEKVKTDTLISHEVWKELTTPRVPITVPFESKVTEARPSGHATPSSYCLGWVSDAYMYPGEIMICHSGGLPGFSSLVTMLPDRDIGVVVVGNGGMSTPITEAVAKELFGRRLGLSKEERRRGVDKVTEKKDQMPAELPLQDVPALSTADENARLPTPQEKVNLKIDTTRLIGDFIHPAYGTFNITTAPVSSSLTEKTSSINNAKIIRQQDQQEEKKPESSADGDEQSRPLYVVPRGDRGMATSYLLHPAPDQPYSDKIIFDQETLWSHGDLSKETVKGLEPDIEESHDDRYPLKKAVVWQSIGIKESAAVFELIAGSSADDARVGRLGLRLMRVDGPPRKKDKNGPPEDEPILERGWERRMIWFSKLYT